MTKIHTTAGAALRTALIAGASLIAMTGAVHAQSASGATQTPEQQQARIEALEAQLEALSGQIADLKAATAASLKDVRTAQAQTTVSIAGGKPTIASGDGAFSANIHAVMQLDATWYNQDSGLPATTTGRDLNSGTNFRRARLGVDGKAFKNFDYGVLLDFGGAGTDGAGQLQELYLQYNYAPFKVKVGAFAPNLGLEDAASTNGSLFPERPSGSEATRGLAGADRRISLQAQAVGERWLISGAVTGAKAGDGATFDEQLGYVGRVAFIPFKGYDWLTHVGVNASRVAQPAQTAVAGAYPITVEDRPELRTDGTRLVSTGAIDSSGARHYGLELAAQKKNFLIQGEYFDIALDRRNRAANVTDPKFSGWYLEGGWVLTGEQRKYNAANFAFDAPAIENPFDPKAGKWGAWELAARYSVLDLNHHEYATVAADRVRGGVQEIATVGLNWFPNSVTKFSLDYLDVDVDRRDAAGLQIGQSYKAVNLRSQYAF
ncbi:phosphate-selective porin OprO/OprP [Caulobacter rhizosphaerae]|uniref:Phosphate-selective porin OprO/OprP n=1 Tax=Caulobacter rhizosphaerae TaxID=2010972 RepID=A0ABU1MXS2_9CAUL|nr:porin [Caulobacter rhizosphaerae]MDR6530506.1 phosphate-selective porin OprO/OprP [Caulobacter rhizosphaerae]